MNTVRDLELAIDTLSAQRVKTQEAGMRWVWVYPLGADDQGECTTAELVQLGRLLALCADTADRADTVRRWLSE